MAHIPTVERVRTALTRAVGRRHVLTDPDLLASYVTDWTGRWTGATTAVVRPGTVTEMAEVVRICGEAGVPMVPQGGNTGLVGGSIPHRGEVVVSTRRLTRLEPVDTRTAEVVVGAGVTVGTLRRHAAEAGLQYGVDLGSRDSATIGGTIATNAGGLHVVAHGDTRTQVVALEAVLAGGVVMSGIGGVRKASTGPDPLASLVGSEGTLGVVTSARVRLVPVPSSAPMVTMAAFDRLEAGFELLGPGVTALEFLDDASLRLVAERRRLPLPLTGGRYFVLVESAGPPPIPDGVEAVVDSRLWAYRDTITETISEVGVPVKLDVAVPPARVDDLADALRELDLGGDTYLFGHLAEANFHVNVVGANGPEDVVDRVLEVVVSMGGVVASEHGIGVAKAEWWRRSLDPAVLAANRRVKEAFDPQSIFNPQVLWGAAPGDDRAGISQV